MGHASAPAKRSTAVRPHEDMGALAHLRVCESSCSLCRYYREHTTVATAAECLLLGRTLALCGPDAGVSVRDLARGMTCDGWHHRPKRWNIHSQGVDANPHWYDPYLSREAALRLQQRFARKQLRKRKGDGDGN